MIRPRQLVHGMSLVAYSCAFTLAMPTTLPAVEVTVRYQEDILPLLTNRCFRCHGPDAETREAGLRLDDPVSTFGELDSGSFAIVRGDPENSELVDRIYSTDEDLIMPPPNSGNELTDGERELLHRWVAEGAEYEVHWSFALPKQPTVPHHDDTWVRNSIDQFVLDRLITEQLKPQPEAARYRLARRVSLALTGLPPQWSAAEQFATSANPAAYARYVDSLLESATYGERWARVWLDLARYADSAGYAQDPPRTIWKYRDWVINAINDNMLFDQFTVEQLAGDLLPGATEANLIATGFHRNTLTNSEGGTDDEEFRCAAVVDRVNTTMQVWMGITMGCAQCHDHKYDPISQKEYFQFYAILNNTQDADFGDETPTLRTYTTRQQRQRVKLDQQIAAQEQVVRQSGNPPVVLPTGPIRARYVRIDLPGERKFLSLAEVQAFVVGEDGNEKNVAIDGTAKQSTTAFAGPAELAIDGNTNGNYNEAKSTTHTAEEDNPWWEVDLGASHEIQRVAVWNRTDPGVEDRLAGFRLILLDADQTAVWITKHDAPPDPSVEIDVPTEFSKIATAAEAMLKKHLEQRSVSPQRERLNELKKQLAEIKGVTTPIMRELPMDRQRPTQIHVRGNFLVRGDPVTANTPQAFPPLRESAKPDRLSMARWLVSRRNPLTARVVVNRIWEQLFGVGLVNTSEDFGRQGNLPSHPKLLDHLAVGLMDHDWDTKWLVRQIVTSATYRQSAHVSDELAQRDPTNRLLARGPRFRLGAEMIRDQALAVSGLLSVKMLGPSVRPVRPNLGLKAAFGGSTDWQTSPGEDRYRRGLYTTWRRTTPYPSLTTFDAPSREFCTVRRIRTNTPLQALVTLNDPVYVEAAQAVARRIVGPTSKSVDINERADYGFRLCLIRPPTDDELERLVELYEQAHERLRENQRDAEYLATVPLGPYVGDADVVDLAAWTVVANVMLNLDEFLSR